LWSRQIVSASQSNLVWNSGSVGIGVSNPLAKLQIDGNVSIGSAYATTTPPSNGLIVSGNVGIGITNPQAALHVNGTVKGTSFEGVGTLITNLDIANLTGTIPVLSGGTGVTAVMGSGSNVLNNTPTLVTPIIGAATGTSLEVTGAITSSGGGIGYATGAGGTLTQGYPITSTVTLNKLTGVITVYSNAYSANEVRSFSFDNSFIAATDHVICSQVNGVSSISAFLIQAVPYAGRATINVRNISSTTYTNSVEFQFTVIKSVNS